MPRGAAVQYRQRWASSRIELSGNPCLADTAGFYHYREAQADGEYAEALARCGAAAAALDPIQGLAVADGLAASIDELASDTAVQLASALQAVCTDFHGSQFMRVNLRVLV